MPVRPSRLAASLQALQSVDGYASYCRGDLGACLPCLQRQVRENPDDGPAWELLGLALRDAGNPQHAADALERASVLHCVQPLSRICLAECYAIQKRHDLACELYLMQADALSDDVVMLLVVASGLDGIDRPHLALEVCRAAAFADPQVGQVAYDMCYYSMRCGCSASVAKSLAWRAVELEPDNVHFRIGLSSLLLRLGERERAAWVLGRLGEAGFSQMTCCSCLERVAELYQEIGDERSSSECLERLKLVRAAG